MEGHHSLKADNRDKPGIKNLHGLTRKLLGFFLPGMTDKKKKQQNKTKMHSVSRRCFELPAQEPPVFVTRCRVLELTLKLLKLNLGGE